MEWLIGLMIAMIILCIVKRKTTPEEAIKRGGVAVISAETSKERMRKLISAVYTYIKKNKIEACVIDFGENFELEAEALADKYQLKIFFDADEFFVKRFPNLPRPSVFVVKKRYIDCIVN